MAEAITHVSTITPSGSVTDIEFTSIPATYDDLLFIGTLKGANTGAWTPSNSGNQILFGDSSGYWTGSGDYNYQELYDRYSNSTFLGYQNNYSSAGASYTPAAWYMYVPGYAVTTNAPGRNFQIFAGCISNSTNTEQHVAVTAGMILKYTAIEKIKFSSGVGNFTTSSKMSLYGIQNT